MTDKQIKRDTIKGIDQSSTNEHTHTHTEFDIFIYEKIILLIMKNFRIKYLELKLCHSFKLALDLPFVG